MAGPDQTSSLGHNFGQQEQAADVRQSVSKNLDDSNTMKTITLGLSSMFQASLSSSFGSLENLSLLGSFKELKSPIGKLADIGTITSSLFKKQQAGKSR